MCKIFHVVAEYTICIEYAYTIQNHVPDKKKLMGDRITPTLLAASIVMPLVFLRFCGFPFLLVC